MVTPCCVMRRTWRSVSSAARGEIPEDGLAALRLHVEQDAPLAPVDDAVRGHRAVRRVDLDHVGAVLAEDPPAAGAGENLREVEDPQSFERLGNVFTVFGRLGGRVGGGGRLGRFRDDRVAVGVRQPAGPGRPA